MNNLFGSVEVAFAASYAKTPVSSIRITTEPPRTLNVEEAEQSAGYFEFSGNAEFRSRFIIWRARGSNLYLEERCMDEGLEENSLVICLHGSQIIPGTSMVFADGFLFIYVPTQTAIHRFFLHIPPAFSASAATKSILSLLCERSSNLRQVHDSYELNSQSIAIRAHIAHTKLDLYAAFFLRDTQLIRIRMNSFPATLPNVEVACLHSDGFLQRMVRTSGTKNVSSMASCTLGGECLFYVLFNNGVVQVYSKNGKEYSKHLMDCFNEESFSARDNTATFSRFKIEGLDGMLRSLCLVQNGNNENYVMISKSVSAVSGRPKELLEPFKTVLVPSVDVVDFSFLSNGADRLLVLSRNEYKHSSLMSVAIDWSTNGIKTWEVTRSPCVSGVAESNLMIDRVEPSIAKRTHIFDQNNYSFGVVLRSATLVCKHRSCETQLQKLRPNDWNGLKNVIDYYVNSPHFQDQFKSRASRTQSRSDSDDELNKLKFWTALEKSCDELLEAECSPLAIWQSNSFGLYGTLQKGRFTVCVDVDDRMEAVRQHLSPRNVKAGTLAAFEKCLTIADWFSASQNPEEVALDEKRDDFVHYFSIASTLAGDLVKKFLDCCAVDLKKHKDLLIEQNLTDSRADAFLLSMVAAALRQRVNDRLRFSDGLLQIIKIYHMTAENFKASVARWSSSLAANESSLGNFNKQYRILARALAIRIQNHRTQTETSVGDAFFFDGGLELVKSYSLAEEYLEEDTGDTDMELHSCEAADISRSFSRFDPTFLANIISTAIALLWPENSDLQLAQYLSRSAQHDALLDFCLLNEPYNDKLMYAFQFFKGVAYAGIDRPEDAAHIFLDAFRGIEKRDDAMLKAVFLGRKNSATSAEFFLKIMEIMERQNCSEQIVSIGRLAVHKVESTDPLLAHVYTMLFKHELATSRYVDCIRTLLKNPLNDNRKTCLRELIAKLIDSRKRTELVSLNYSSMQENVVEILEARARTADAADEEFLYEILYAFHFRRNNFSKAALSMYEFASRFRSQLQSRETLARRCQILCVVQQTIALLPVQSRYLTVPCSEGIIGREGTATPVEDEKENRSGDGHMGKGDSCGLIKSLNVLDDLDVAKEFVLEDARLALLDESIALNSTDELSSPTNVQDVLDQLLENNHFDRAWLLAQAFNIPPYAILKTLALECIRYYASGESAAPLWATSNLKEDSTAYGESDRCYAVLRGYVREAVRLAPYDAQVLRSVCDVFLRYQWPIPCWLSTLYEERCLGDYWNLLLLYGQFDVACASVTKAVEAVTLAVTSSNSRVILPHTAIDQLIYLAAKNPDLKLKEAMKRLDEKLRLYFNRLDSFSRI